MLAAHGGFLPLFGIFACPGGAEGRVLEHEAHFHIGETVFFKGVGVAEVVGLLALDEHFCQAHGVRDAVVFLAEELHICRGVEVANVVVGGGEHATGAAGLVANGDDFVVVEDVVAALGQQQGDAKLDDVSAGVELTGLHILEEAADEVFKDVAHADAVELLQAEVELGEGLDHGVEAAVFVHLVDVGGHLQLLQDVDNVFGEAGEVGFEVGGHVVGVVAELCQGEAAGVVKAVATQGVHGSFGVVGVGLKFVDYRLFGGLQCALKAADDGHGDDDIAVFVGHV